MPQIHPTGVLLSLDVFGVMAWQRPVDLAHTGQDIVAMAKHCDVLSPMIYPSHFFGMDGIAHPGDAPEHFIGESMDRFKLDHQGQRGGDSSLAASVCLADEDVLAEVCRGAGRGGETEGGIGFLFWNANNDYTKPYAAMPEMRAAKGDTSAATKLVPSRNWPQPRRWPRPRLLLRPTRPTQMSCARAVNIRSPVSIMKF